MEPVNILEARNRLSQLISAATSGEEVVIAKRGRPVVRLVSVDEPTHTAGSLAVWLTHNPVPPRANRDTTALDAQIRAERDGWE